MCRSRFATPFSHRGNVLRADRRHFHAAVKLQSAHGRDDDRRGRTQARLAAFDVDEFLRAQICAEARLRHDVVAKLERRARCDHRVAAVRDIGERSAVNESRIVLKRLHEVRGKRLLQEHRHGALRVQIARPYRPLCARVADDDVAEALLQILEARRQAEDRHDLRGDDDVEAILARKAVGGAAKTDGERAQRAVVHIDDAPPADAAHVDAELVAVIDVIVDERGQQIVRKSRSRRNRR